MAVPFGTPTGTELSMVRSFFRLPFLEKAPEGQKVRVALLPAHIHTDRRGGACMHAWGGTQTRVTSPIKPSHQGVATHTHTYAHARLWALTLTVGAPAPPPLLATCLEALSEPGQADRGGDSARSRRCGAIRYAHVARPYAAHRHRHLPCTPIQAYRQRVCVCLREREGRQEGELEWDTSIAE
jgi:hypothetical protein